MGSQEKPFFDLNELPADNCEEGDSVFHSQPQKVPYSSHTHTCDVFSMPEGPQRIVNSNAFSHACSLSGFQPFVKPKDTSSSEECAADQKRIGVMSHLVNLLSNGDGMNAGQSQDLSFPKAEAFEREEGEWSDDEGSLESSGIKHKSSSSHERHAMLVLSASSVSPKNDANKDGVNRSSGLDPDSCDLKNNNNLDVGTGSNSNAPTDSQGDSSLDIKQKEVKGVEAKHALKHANSPGNRQKFDEQKVAMLGKKRSRQVMYVKFEDVKQAGPIKTSTSRRQNFPSSTGTRTLKETHTPSEHNFEKKSQLLVKDKLDDVSCNSRGPHMGTEESKLECNGEMNSGMLTRPLKSNSSTDLGIEVHPPTPIPRQSSWKQQTDTRQAKNSQTSLRVSSGNHSSMEAKLGNKRLPPFKKPAASSSHYPDTSVERLLREVTNEKFWHHPERTELQCVPGCFESVDDYVRVFEPLLFEECRAQLYSTWEELMETVSRDQHFMVRVKNVERRERGWYDVIVVPAQECTWIFKEGDVAIISSSRPGSVRSRRVTTIEDDEEPEVNGRVAGTVRRHMPVDKRDPHGAILHFYVGDFYVADSKVESDHILNKLHPKGVWYLTVLGSVATTQREYIALHAFRLLNLQMQNAILQPSPDHFPKYEQQSPATPECFTVNFADYLNRTFNGPQLAAIQWAAMHTAAGTSSGASKRQDPWPFTLVQGPPGTGKTHTVWGMLNVIHLVQYQHYYTALLKTLAPESYKQATDRISDNAVIGSIDEVLQNMDENLFRTLPKLCPKPRMLVCAPSNAATDELLARVLDRGFIDGEMKVYRPDVARVGVDSQSRAAQAVSVERRTEQLLCMSRNEVLAHMHHCRGREVQYSQQIAALQRELNATAMASRSQGSVGVDLDVLVARNQNRDMLLQNLAAVVEARDKNLVDMSRFLSLEKKFSVGGSYHVEDARASLEASFANEAEIVFTTVSSSGRRLFSRLSHGFDMVVIDEAAQASEVGVLPALSLGAARCVLVGDPQQLPATVISKAAGTLLYSRSLFERFQQAGCPTILLSVQYRMHPQIRDFPSRYFYQGRLTDSESIVSSPDEIYYRDPLLKPYLFYDMTHGRESHRGGSVSYQNVYEAQFCLHMYEHLQKTLKSSGLGKVSVGIITPYKLQLKCLRRAFEHVLSSEEGRDVYINTVDAFQGQERDIIIMSCVRASGHGVGFVADIRRMNVALTRARRALWVMGNASALYRSDDWAALITDAKSRNCFMDMEFLPKDFPVLKGPSYNPINGNRFSSMRGLGPGLRHRPLDMQMDSRSGTPSEDDERSVLPVIPTDGIHRS